MFSPSLALDSILYLRWIPVELRRIIKNYVIGPLGDDNIHEAAKLWMDNKEMALLRFGTIAEWDTKNVTNMSYLFSIQNILQINPTLTTFNDNIEDWDVSNLVTMEGMFQGCANFNQPLNKWNTSKVTTMAWMFHHCHVFNQPLDNWDTHSITTMYGTFCNAHAFNQDIHAWNVSAVRNMIKMFEGAHAFNQPLNDWDLSQVEYTICMFKCAYRFNQPLNDWDVNRVTVTSWMFEEAVSFNQPLDHWQLSRCSGMGGMFKKAVKFNQSLRTWNLYDRNIETTHMFLHAYAFDSGKNGPLLTPPDENNEVVIAPVIEGGTNHDLNNRSRNAFKQMKVVKVVKSWYTLLRKYYTYILIQVHVWENMNGFYYRNKYYSILTIVNIIVSFLTVVHALIVLLDWWMGDLDNARHVLYVLSWSGTIARVLWILRANL